MISTLDERSALPSDGREIHLTPTEFALLGVLLRHRGRLLTHESLLQQVWGPSHAHDTPTLRTHMANLRRKLASPPSARCTAWAIDSTRRIRGPCR